MSKIDYDLTKIRGIAFDVDGVLSPSTVPLSSDGNPQRMCNVKDGYALQLAVKKGLKISIITGGRSEAVGARMSLLGIKAVWQGVADKLPVLKKWMVEEGLSKEEVIYVGDDIPDLRCMREVGLPCCPYDAAWEAKSESRYISSLTGGYGVGRDIIEQVLKAKGLWATETHDVLTW